MPQPPLKATLNESSPRHRRNLNPSSGQWERSAVRLTRSSPNAAGVVAAAVPEPFSAPVKLDPGYAMDSITEPVAHALAFEWGELEEKPPDFIHDLMVDLTRALEEAERTGNEGRAGCLDDVLHALSQGIAKHEGRVDRTPSEEEMSRAIAELRDRYALESDLPNGGLPK